MGTPTITAGLTHGTLLRLATAGSVDDGKSTLIGRLLYDSRQIFEDQLAALEADSKRLGTQGQEIDFALLVDGLAAERVSRDRGLEQADLALLTDGLRAEREQGITIDVA